MSKFTKKIIQVLMIFSVATILGVGLFLLEYLTQHPYQGRQISLKNSVVDPEEILDEQVVLSSRNYSKVFNDDLTETYEFRMHNVQYLKDDGQYENIDTKIVNSDGDYKFENITNVYKTYFKENLQDDNAISFVVAGNRGVSFSFLDNNQTKPKVEDNKITYPNLYDGVDVRYTVDEDLLLEEFVIKDVAGASLMENINQKLKLDAVYYKEQKDGSIIFYDIGTKNIVFIVPRPVMYEEGQADEIQKLLLNDKSQTGSVDEVQDVNKEHIPVNYGLNYEIIQAGDEYILRKVINESGKKWLENANYPLIVDGTFTYPTWGSNVNGEVWRSCNNTLCSSYSWGQNFISQPSLVTTFVTKQWPRIWASDSITGKRRTHLYFVTSGLQSVPVESIVFAQLRVTGFPYSDSSLWYMPAGYSDVEVYSNSTPYFLGSDNMQQWFNKIGAMSSYDGVFSTSDSIPSRSNWNQTYCQNNPSACTHYVNIAPSSVANTGVVNIGLREDAIPYAGHVNEWNWHGAKIFTQRGLSSVEPVLTVIVLTKPSISIQVPLYSEWDRLDIDITDASDNEDSWELERSLNGSSGWTNICTANTGANGSCSGGGTYACTGTSKVGTGGICTVTNTGLTGDTLYYYRARARINTPAALSAYSNIANERTSAQVSSSTPLIPSSPAWNIIELTGGMTFPPINQPLTGTTSYNIGIFGQFTNSGTTWRYNGNFTGSSRGASDAVLVIPFSTSPHNRVSLGSYQWLTWYTTYFGIGNNGKVRLTGNPTNNTAPYPNREIYIGESAVDTRSPYYIHDMNILNLAKLYTRARDPSPPTIGIVTATTIEETLNIAPYTSPSTHTNPPSTEYAMSVENLSNGEIQWFGDISKQQFFLPGIGGMPEIPDWGTPDRWALNNPRQVYGLSAATCYRFSSISRNANNLIGENVNEGFPSTIPDNYNYNYSASYPYTDVCTPIYTPSTPTVSCNYDTINGYYCDVTINDSLNPTPPYFYKIERSYNGTSGWTTVQGSGGIYNAQDWSKTFQNLQPARIKGLTCNTSTNTLYYRITASITGNNTESSNSDSSASGTDTLPPCQPGAPTVSGFPPKSSSSITWSWTVPVSAETIDQYNFLDQQPNPDISYNNILPNFFHQWSQSGLGANTGHQLKMQACDRSSSIERCGEWSLFSNLIYTYANNPTISVVCNWNATDKNNCNISLSNHNGNLLNYSPEYCLSRQTATGWDYYIGNSWTPLGSIACWRDAYSTNWNIMENKDSSGTPFTCDTSYTYRMQAKNNAGEITSFVQPVSDTTPACPPYSLGHNNNIISGNNYYINWTWTNANNLLPIDIYENNNSCSGTKKVNNLTAGSTSRNIYWTGAPNVNKTISICYDEGIDVYGQPATASAFTHIQNPTGISLNTSSKDQITINRTSTLSNVDSFRDSVAYYYNAAASNGGTGGSNSGWIDDGNDSGGSWTDNGLQTNYEYCYRIRARNNQNTNPPYSTITGDISSYSPIACLFTYAEIPKRPIRSQVNASTVNIIIRDDGNPHGPAPADDTKYAICVTEYNMDGSVNQEGYVQSDNTISWLATGLECGDNGDLGVIWNTQSGWGGISGVDITGVVSSTKFGFSIKAENGNGISTNFGPEATLFLVKNNVVGWAWSSNIGWVSMNCLNLFSEPSLGFSCKKANDWGINTSFEPTRQINPLEGYAWSASGYAKSLGSCEVNNIGQSCNNNSDCGAGGTCTGPSIGVKTGLGWISFNKSVCSNDSQQGCIDDNECGTALDVCVDTTAKETSENILVAGDTPDSITYGFCYNDTVLNNGEKYGVCSDNNGIKCTETNVLACADPTTATCILETCKTGDICSDYDDFGPMVAECRPTATASFNGETREIEGWARILSQKEQGESYSPPFTDWGWLKLGGQYDDGQGNTGNYNLTGTEIDSQLFLGDPDVDSNKLSLYTFFGWGWNATVSDYSTTTSKWLTPALVSKNLNNTFLDDWQDVSMVMDTDGNPHLAWSQYNATNGYFDIYYAKLEAGRWVTITGEEYQSGDQNFNANTSNLDVSFNAGLVADGVSSRFPSLVLDSSGLPHIAGQYGTYAGGSSVGEQSGIFYTYWNGSAWQSYSQVQEVPASTPSLALSSNNTPYIAYRYGGYINDSEIYLEVWNGDAWNTITNDGFNLSVSKGAGSSSSTPRLKINNDIPYVVWQELFTGVEHIFYRWWNGSDWVSVDNAPASICSNNFTATCTVATESTDCGAGQCISESTSVNWGILTCGGGQTDKKCYNDTDCTLPVTCDRITKTWDSGSPYGINGSKPDLDFFSDDTPGVVFNNANKVMFRKWDGTVWSDIDGGVADNVLLNKEINPIQPTDTYYEQAFSTNSLVIDAQDQPHIVFTGTELYSAIEGQFDIRYLYWDNAVGDWVTSDKIYPHKYDDSVGVKAFVPPTFNVSNSATWKSQSSILSLDRWGNPYIGWIDTQSSGIGCDAFGTNGVIDGIDGEVHDIAVDRDNNVIYLAGVSDNSGDHWRINKRRFDNGNLTTDFGWNENLPAPIKTTDGIIIGDTHSREAWNMEMDKINNHLYIIGRDWSGDDWRLEKRYMDSGDRVAGFGNADDANWPAAPAGVVRMGYGTVVYGIDMQIDNNYIYIAGTDDSANWRIEKRSKLTGDLVAGFGGSGISDINTDPAGVITSTTGEDARKIIIDELYMWVIGRDANDWRIEKRLLSNGSLVSSFGANGVFTGSSSSPDSHSIYDVVIDGDYIYVAGRTNNNNWLIGKLNKNTAALDTNFDTDGYVEVASGDYIYGIEISGNDIITAGRTGNDWHYEIRDKNTGNINPLTFTNGWQNGEITSADGLFVWGMSSDDDYMYAFGYDDYDTCIANACSISGGFCNTTAECPDKKNWRLERRWKSTGVLDNSSSVIDCKDPDYQTCNWVSGGPSQCIGSNLMFTRWSPGRVQNGLGWVEFMPAGALLGIPWVQTAYADIYGTTGVSLAPPPRGSGEYSATYLILSNGNIQGIPTFYSGDTSQQPTTQFYEGGLNPLIEGSGLPFGENALSKVNVDALVSDIDGDGFNRYGHKLISVAVGDIATNLGASPVLDGAVYYVNGDATIDSEITFMKGDSLAATETLGNGLIVVDGDLEINDNTLYNSTLLADLTEMPSVGFIVRGNIYISPFVTKLSGAFVALDNPATTNISEGIISTSRKAPVIKKISSAPPDENDTYVSFEQVSNLYTANDNLTNVRFGQETSEYEFRQKITFSNMADLGVVNNFPLLVNINATNTNFWNAVNLGSNPRNNVAFTDANGVSLDFHFEKFDAAANDAIAWVEIPELVTDGTDYIYMYYDNDNTLANAENQSATYDDNFKAVYHLDETGTGTRFNSTQYSHDGAPYDYEGDEGVMTGKFGGADQMDGSEGDGSWREGICNGGTSNGLMCTSAVCQNGTNPNTVCTNGGSECIGFDANNIPGTCNLPNPLPCPGGGTCDTTWQPTGDYIDLGPDIISGSGDFTTEAWVKLTSGHYSTKGKNYTIIQQQDDTFGGNGTYLMRLTTSWVVAGTKIFGGNTAEWLNEDRNNDGNTDGYTNLWDVGSEPEPGGYNYDDGAWHYVVMTQDNGIQGGRLYIDGVEVDHDSQTEHGMCRIYSSNKCIDNTDCTYYAGDYCDQDYWGVAKIDGNNRTYIGVNRNGEPKIGGYFNGTIDEVRISDVARTPDFIKASYRIGSNNTNDIIDPANSWLQEAVGNTTKMSRSFLRWSIGPGGDLDIPPGAEIRNAYLNLYGNGNAFGDIEGRIYLMDESDNSIDSFDSLTYSMTSNLYNVSTSNSVKYDSLISEWNNNGVNKTPDIKSLVSRFISSDEYEQNYHDGLLTYIGLSIQEDTSTIGGQRNIYSAEDLVGNAPELVVEYSPRRTYLQVENQADDIGAWGSLAGNYQTTNTCLNFGWNSSNPNRIFYRFVPDPIYTSLPDNAEILEAHLRAANSGCAAGNNGFQMRQGLINDVNFDNGGSMTTNPYAYPLTQDVFEISEDIATGAWTSGTYVFRDISTLIQSWVDSRTPDYALGNSVGLRLRRDNNSNEIVAGLDEYRAISQQATTLEVDYLVPLQVSGLFIARGYNFDRKYSKDLAPAERIVYDGRVVANTPPGLADFSKALPIYQRVAP